MATLQLSARRLILAGGFAVAVAAAPAVAAFAVPGSTPAQPLAQCPAGEEEDLYTGICLPHTVPNSPLSSIPGNPDLPAVDGVPCTGRNTGECIGLAESQEGSAFVPPQSSISSSP